MDGERVSVSFTCQRCLQPVILDDSFGKMDDYARAELACKYSQMNIVYVANKMGKQLKFLYYFLFYTRTPVFSTDLCKR